MSMICLKLLQHSKFSINVFIMIYILGAQISCFMGNSHFVRNRRTFNLKLHTPEVATKNTSAIFDSHKQQRLC